MVTVGFVIFRADSMSQAFGMIGKMFTGFSFAPETMSLWWQQMTPYFIVMFVAAVLLAGGAQNILENKIKKTEDIKPGKTLEIAGYALSFLILVWCILRLSGGVYNPFIYFRF